MKSKLGLTELYWELNKIIVDFAENYSFVAQDQSEHSDSILDFLKRIAVVTPAYQMEFMSAIEENLPKFKKFNLGGERIY